MEQNTHEWHLFRRFHIGSSDAPVIMGDSPWKTRYQLWQEKTGRKEPGPVNYAMKHGTAMEESARVCYERTTGNVVFPEVLVHKDHEWMSASLDGIDITGTRVVEIKCPLGPDHEVAVQGGIPQKYYAQCQHILAVSGAEVLDYWSFQGGQGVLVEVKRDDAYIDRMIAEEKEFWRLVAEGIEPALDERDTVECKDPRWLELAKQWASLQDEIKQLQDLEDHLRCELIQSAPAPSVFGAGVVLKRSQRKGNVDYAKVPELKGIDLDRYRKPAQEVWRLSVGQ